MIGHLKVNRAIATRYDKLASSFLDALHLVERCPLLGIPTRRVLKVEQLDTI